MLSLFSDLRFVLLVPLALVLRAILLFIYRHFIRGGKRLESYGSWALVTGATDGIGLAMATELAKRGLNIVLVSRTPSKLTEAAASIKKLYPNRQTKEVAVDFANFNDDAKARLNSVLSEVEVGVLVNNVGLSYDFPDNFHKLAPATVQALIDINVTSTTVMSHLVLPHMLKRRRGLVVSISSAASLLPNPLLAGYSAAKAYVDQFSLSLNAEYERDGVRFQTHNPLYVSTKMAKMRPSLMCPTAKQYARVAVNNFGYEAQASPYWAHALQLAFVPLLPTTLVSSYLYKMHVSIRKRAEKKRAAAPKQE